jgi:hypothetical protein
MHFFQYSSQLKANFISISLGKLSKQASKQEGDTEFYQAIIVDLEI